MRTESPQPDLQKSSSSSSSVVTPSPRADYGVFFSGGEKEGGTATQKHGNKPDNQAFRLNKQTQDGFVGFILPFLSSGKKLSRKDIEVIGNEAKRIGLPLDILKRLFEEHGEYCKQEKQEVTNLQKYRSKEFEDIEDVDESENILAYFSRMATLKEGGHLPKFNTEALESFVETNSSIVSEDVEVDLDVGYVKKSLDLSYDDAYNIHGSDSWDEAYPHEVNSDVSTTIQGRNRYEPGEPDPEASMFGHLLEEDVSPRRVTFALDSDGENEEHRPMKRSERKAPSSNIQEEEKKDEEERKESKPPSRPSHSHRGDRRDWTVCRRRRSIWHYGYEKDLDEWKLKRDMASWQFKPNNNADSVFSRATSCHSGGNSTCNEDNCAGPLTRPPPHISGQDAVRDLFAKKQERLDRRRERNQRLHLPDELEEAPKPWQLAYKERCKACPGYIGVEQYSLLDSTGVPVTPDPHDLVPWENRDVRQHFLHEQSISFSRNWFGRLRRKRGNDLVQYRPCRPKSMEMPTEAITSPDAHVDDATECVYRRTTDAPGKSKVEKDKAVNKTASLSFSSGEDLTNRRRDGGDDESSSYFTQSIYTQSIATPSLNGYSTTFTTTDEGTNYHDDATFTSHSALTGTTGTISMFGMDDDEISAILDADESESANDSGSDHWSKSYSKSSSRDSCRSSKHSRGDGTTSTDDRYRSSFSGTSGSYSADESEDGSSSFNDEDSESSVSSSSHDDGDNETWEEIPECGTLINVKPKINERVSRLTPDHTSHLIRSRFRKKHFPKGSFPYDK